MTGVAPPAGPPPTPPACGVCGYSLAGLGAGASCPECGSPPAAPLAGPPIDAADPIWVGGVRDGLRLVLVGCAIGAASLVLMIVLTALSPWHGVYDAVFGLAMVVASLLGARGWVVATRPEPFASVGGGRHAVNLAARVSAVAGAVAIGGGAIVNSVVFWVGSGGLSDVTFKGMLVAAGIAGAVHVPCAMAFFLHVARLARDEKLARSCRQGTWLMPASYAVYAAMGLYPPGAAWVRAMGSGGLPWSVVGLFLAIATLVASVATLVTPFAYALFAWWAYRHAKRSLGRRGSGADC